MVEVSSSPKIVEAPLKPVGNSSSFILKLQDHYVLAVRLPKDAVREISGEALAPRGGIFSRFKAKMRFALQTETWLIVTSADNPMLEQFDNFQASLAQELASATGEPVSESNVSICATVALTKREQLEPGVE